MATVGNTTCVRLDNVARFGAHHELEATPFLLVKGTWLPSEFSISVCDGNDAWTARAGKDFVLNIASHLAMTESEYVDRIQFYFSKQQPGAKYELKWGKHPSPELVCYKELPYELILRLQTTADSGTGVAVDMVQFMLDAHHGINEELARKTRAYERDIAAKELSLSSLKKQLEGGKASPQDHTNGRVNVVEEDVGFKSGGGGSTRSKRKAGAGNAETGSRKRAVRTSEAMPLFQKPPSSEIVPLPVPLEDQSPSARPPPLSELGYNKQRKVREERFLSEEPSWLERREAENLKRRSNGVTDDSLSEEGQSLATRKVFLNHLPDVAVASKDTDVVPGKKGSGKKQGKESRKPGAKSNKKAQPQPSLEDSVDLVEDIVEKSIKCVDNIGSPHVLKLATGPEVSSFLTTPVKQQRKTPTTAKKTSKSSSRAKKSTSRSSKRKAKPTVVESSVEASEDSKPPESPEVTALPDAGVDEDRAITVQNAEFHDFDESRTESHFKVGQFWALYDDQDGMPRFYGRLTHVDDNPFGVTVQWLESFKPNLPASCLVKSSKLSTSCGEFTLGSESLQDLPAFSHLVEVQEFQDPKKPISLFPEINEIWALYRQWDEKLVKKEDGEVSYEYDVVRVKSKASIADGVTVVRMTKVEGFKSLFTVGLEEYTIPHKLIQARFSHCIPAFEMLGSESPGVPVGAFELDPASTPGEYLGSAAHEG